MKNNDLALQLRPEPEPMYGIRVRNPDGQAFAAQIAVRSRF
jgi:hypothetical protein